MAWVHSSFDINKIITIYYEKIKVDYCTERKVSYDYITK